ncbi:MAG: T9SS type A sorting domain-containing protein, partial [Bacteroidales bacterium]|nr:T9SS type A sorting domain-containing protein [Bacteroidales bacterium]
TVLTEGYVTANGCDSTHTISLTINHSVATSETVVACDSWQGFTADTVLTEGYVTANGCDSTHTISLTINHSTATYDTIMVENEGLPITYAGEIIDAPGDYEIAETAVNGCDSIIYLHISVQPVGIDLVDESMHLVIYPNPTKGTVHIEAEGVDKIEVIDETGRWVKSVEKENFVDISNLPNGSYLLKIRIGHTTVVRRVLKQ